MQWSAWTGEGGIRPPPSDSGGTPGTACSTRGRAPAPGWAPGRSCPASWAACPPCVRGPPWSVVFLCGEEGGRWLPLSWVSAAARAAPASQLPHHTPREGRFKLPYTPLSSDQYTLVSDRRACKLLAMVVKSWKTPESDVTQRGVVQSVRNDPDQTCRTHMKY